MTKREFSILNKYLGSDAYAYLVIKKNKFLEPSDWRSNLYQKLKEILPSEKMIHINVNFMNEKQINLQNISKTERSNALLLRRDVLMEVFGSQMELDFAIAKKIIFIKERSSIYQQERRKSEHKEAARKKRETINKNAKAILNGENNFIPRKDWMEANAVALKKKATQCESLVYNRLKKSLHKRVKQQIPFTINGNVYFADMVIKCKRLIIEVDGGYHNTEEQRARDMKRDEDFASIGYTTLRISNEDVKDGNKLSKFVNDIIKTNKKGVI